MRGWFIDIYTRISEHGILAGIFVSFVVIIISYIFKLPARLVNKFGEFSGIYNGNAEDLICDNFQLDREMVYIIRGEINHYGLKVHSLED